MRTETVLKPTLLSDYSPPNFKLDSVYLDFDLYPDAARVRSKMKVKRLAPGSLLLNGEAIDLKSISINGQKLKRVFARSAKRKVFAGSLTFLTGRMS